MRNLKKTLCLILALVFVLGLCTVGAADIEFTDEKNIQYKEAVQAMAGLGILKGDDNDRDGKMEFRPKDSLTRAEAAKIIAYVARGPEIENWINTQVFDDVPASHWAAKYIAYCSNQGIINGVGNNKFDPNGKVTVVAMMKMLLAACGYGFKDEFTGANWDTNVGQVAFETKLLQGLNAVDWYAPATREETAQLAYTALMNIVLVTYSNNTNSYVPRTVNGTSNVTMAETTWGLRTDEGVIIANKANSSTAKGTILSGTRVAKYYVTEEDENPAVIGHQVRITYRTENINGNDVAVAYFMEDKCTEVKGTEAARVSDAANVFSFSSGQLMSYTVPARETRATLPGVFVLNEDNLVVSYKTEGYFISVITISPYTLQSTVVDPATGYLVSVQAPAGAITGDLVTVYHMGDVYTCKLCTKLTNVYIEQMGRDLEGNCTYNNGSIYPSKSELLTFSSLPLSVTRLGGTTPQLELGCRYTLFFDDQGGCIGFSDKAGSGSNVGAAEFGLLAATYTMPDAYGTPAYYAQVILGDGTRVNQLPISKETYESTLFVNNVYKLTNTGSYWTFSPVGTAEVSVEAYNLSDPFTDYTNAAYIWYNGGSLSTLDSSLNKVRPQTNSTVIIAFMYERSGLGTVRKVRSVWFTNAASNSVVPVSNSFIYVASIAAKSSYIVNGRTVNAYDGYLNGRAMDDLVTAAAPNRIGFASYSKNTSTGVYTLSFLADGNGTSTGVRTVQLVDSTNPDITPDNVLMPNSLSLKDGLGNWQTMSLTGVTVAKVGAAAGTMLPISSVQELINTVAMGYKVTITLVELVSGSTHSVGGSAIYVTSITA